jgi:aminopeptidase N
MNGLVCPAPAPCPTTSAASAESLRYTFSGMRTHSLTIAVFLLTATTVSAQRLPTTVTPVHYDLTVTPRLADGRFNGQEAIDVRVATATPTVVLNAAEITFGDVSVTAAGRQQKAAVTLDATKEQATFTFPNPIPAGEARLTISYEGILNDDLRGLYLSKANNRRYAVTQLEATDARRMFPSFDEPAFKATYALTAIIDKNDTAISNGAVVSDTPGPGPSQHTVKFETTPKMSTYLVALTVGDFECISGNADGTPVRICSTPDKKALTGFALESTRRIVEYYNRYYSIKYPFKKLDIVAVPDFSAGAMENTGAIFYRETLLLAAPDASVGVRKNVAEVLAHEIAHQWFGDLVTMQWWDDIWLNEGFANWMMSKPLKEWRPDWKVELDEVDDNHVAMGLDSLRATRPIRSKASTPSEISELFDPIAYEKGAAVLRMLESWIGPNDFRKAVNAYIEKFQYGNARAEDFWGTLTTVTGKPVDKVMASFVDQPGLPLVSVDLRCAGGTSRAVLSQERYFRDPAQATKDTGQLWQIPVCLHPASGDSRCEVLKEKRQEMSFDGCPAWVMGNASARGYYRTAMPPAMVRTMAEKVEMLAPAERMAVLSDEWALVRGGQHDVGTFMDLASGFADERTATVLDTLAGILRSIGDEYTTAGTRESYRAWVRKLIAPALRESGVSGSPSDDDERKALRAVVVGIAGGIGRDPQVLATARQLVQQELDKPGTVESTLLGYLVSLAAIGGDTALYDRYLQASKAATEPAVRYRYLYGLTAFTDPGLVRRTMDIVVSEDVRSQDAKNVIARMVGNQDTHALAWQLMRERWDAIQKKTGEFVGNTIIVGSLSSFCDSSTAAEIKTFFGTHKVPDAERTLQQSLERISTCAQGAAGQAPKLAAWLKAPGR